MTASRDDLKDRLDKQTDKRYRRYAIRINQLINGSPFEISVGGAFSSFEETVGATATNLFLAAGPIFNLDAEDLENSFFGGARAAFVRTHSGLYEHHRVVIRLASVRG